MNASLSIAERLEVDGELDRLKAELAGNLDGLKRAVRDSARAYMQAARQASIAPEDSACRREAERAEAQYDEDLDILAVAIHGHDACAWPQ